MKKLILVTLFLISIIRNTSFSQCDHVQRMDCCSYVVVDTLDQSEFTILHTSPHVVITPPAGYAVKFSKPPIMKVIEDGVPLGYSSGESVNVENDETQFAGTFLSQFGDAFFYKEGIYSGSFWHSYMAVWNGQTIMTSPSFVSSGRVFLRSTWSSPIFGGGPNAMLIFTFTYDLVPY